MQTSVLFQGLAKFLSISRSAPYCPLLVCRVFSNNVVRNQLFPEVSSTFDQRLRAFLLAVKENSKEFKCLNIEKKSGQHFLEAYEIQALTTMAEKLIQAEKDVEELKALNHNDGNQNEDLAKMIQEEFVKLSDTITQIHSEVLDLVLKEDYAQTQGIIMEFSAGVGGQEAMLFCNELLEMYCNYCTLEEWDHEVTDYAASELEGARHATLCINHPEAYYRLQFEGGVHRVQRVPKTEKAGRIHTSTVAVAILPQPTEVTVTIDPKDLKMETKRASGAGGQHVNTTESAVRITHLPTGLVAECQTQRSQPQNRQVAINKLRARLFQIKIDKQLAATRSNRKLQVGSSSRSEKIRTYNFPQDRITDHRINFTSYNLGDFLRGARTFEILLGKLEEESRKERLAEFLDQVKISSLASFEK